MTTNFVFPDTKAIQLIEQEKLPNLMAQREIFNIFGTETVDEVNLEWEQRDNWGGLQMLRGIDGQPARVQRSGFNTFLAKPGVFGEYTELQERDLLNRRSPGTVNTRIDVSDLVLEEHEKLIQRELDRLELIGWTLLTTGTFSISAPHGGVTFTDSYNTQAFDATVGWSTFATATPLSDFREVKLLQRGHSVRFDQSASAFMNSQTLINMLSNTNTADLYGRRTSGLATINSVSEVKSLFAMDNLPQIVEYDEGYLDADNGTFHTWIPDNKVVVIGNRPSGAKVAAYRFTRNVNNEDMAAGPYMRVIDRANEIPRTIQVHRGHNGGPVMYFPSSIVLMDVS